jgi:hypothetical protein
MFAIEYSMIRRAERSPSWLQSRGSLAQEIDVFTIIVDSCELLAAVPLSVHQPPMVAPQLYRS